MKTRMTELFQIEHPIMCGGMMWLSKPELCAAISNAGALGNLTAANYNSGEDLQQAIRKTREMTDKPFSINLTLLPSFRITKDMYESWLTVCLHERVIAIEISGMPMDKFFGKDSIKRSHDSGVKLIHKVGSVRHAKHAEEVQYDAVIAAGVEEGGHPLADDVTTMLLTPRITEIVKIPVISAGGIADGRGLAAALVLGADGVMMATRFMCTLECNINDKIKQEIINKQEFDTVLYGKTIGLQGRALRNEVIKIIQVLEDKHAGLEELAPLLSGLRQSSIWEDGDCDAGLLPVGQSIGLIHDNVSCDLLIKRIVRECESIFKKFQ